MLTEPTIKTRTAEPYAAKVIEVAQPEIARRAPPLIRDVMEWVEANGGKVAGPPFFNYFEFLPGGRMKMQVGVPTSTVLVGDDDVVTGKLPSGRYASITHTGDYADVFEANAVLDEWIDRQGLAYAGDESQGRLAGGTRLEIYRDPGSKTKPPVTELDFLLRA